MNNNNKEVDDDISFVSSAGDSINHGPGLDLTPEPVDETQKTARIRWLRVLVIPVFLLFLGFAVVSFLALRANERQSFEDIYNDYAAKLIAGVQVQFEQKIVAMESFSFSIVSQANFMKQEWPRVTVSDFAFFAAGASSLAGGSHVSMCPLVSNDDRSSWESFAQSNHETWIEQSRNFELTHSVASQDRLLQDQQEEQQPDYSSGIAGDIFIIDDNEQKYVSTSAGPYFPLWHSYPLETDLINYDHASHWDLKWPLESLKSSKNAVLVGARAATTATPTTANDKAADAPTSYLVVPMLSKDDNKNLVGILNLGFSWETVFGEVLPPAGSSLNVVLVNDCGATFTFELEGSNAVYIGAGDHHDTDFNHMVHTGSIIDINQITQAVRKFQGVPLDDLCNHKLYVYPTQEMRDEFYSSLPVFYVVIMGFVFVVLAILIMFFDRAVNRRMDLILEQAAQSNAIVDSIFPAAFRERLYKGQGVSEEADVDGSASKGTTQQTSTASSDKFSKDFMEKKLKGVLANTNKNHGPLKMQVDIEQPNMPKAVQQDNDGQQNPNEIKHIADRFDSTTILFADIVGFTAWSSQREPGEVFMLLQTLYHAFDTSAKKLGVFKVETVGDCYVAATGLPVPQDDHAVRMAKFAGIIMNKMTELTRELEVTLGPDTGDLRMRVGMHSGPVTAGVLKGEKARFQLFGDTMNTAARMESNSLRNKIQCSPSTAELIIAAGKEHWLRKREDKVKAKGKGDIQTYWVLPRSGGSSMDSGSSTEECDAAEDGNVFHKDLWANMKLVADLQGSGSRYQRLIDWNVELLSGLLRQIASGRQETKKTLKSPQLEVKAGSTALDEITEVIKLPDFDAKAHKFKTNPYNIELKPDVVMQLQDYVTTIASMYRDNSFHNFEHASHVTMSTNKLLKRIVSPDALSKAPKDASELHEYTYGITSDPLTQFALVFCALIHDVDHAGVSNFQLIAENSTIAQLYKNKSVAEQNSVDMAWDLLMDPSYKDLQRAIYCDNKEMKRFRQLVVNIVLATDIFDKDMKSIREKRWDRAFHYEQDINQLPPPVVEIIEEKAAPDHSLANVDGINLKATIVIEHLIQASDVAHTMQHWDIYLKWNERLFREMYTAWEQGRAPRDPSKGWYEGEIIFFDKYIIPLGKKLAECGVFGVSSDEYLNYALLNRKQWAVKGDEVVTQFLERYIESKNEKKPTRSRPPTTVKIV